MVYGTTVYNRTVTVRRLTAVGYVKSLDSLSVSYDKMGLYLTAMDQTEEAGVYYQKTLDSRVQVHKQTGTSFAFGRLSISYKRMGDHLTALDRLEKAGDYYRKFSDSFEQIYEEVKTAAALDELITSHDKLGDNKQALELFEEYIKMNPSARERDAYYRDKVK
jgi:tetratricopeptide (TPR) repeat protein